MRRVERALGRTVTVVPPTEGLIYRGPMVAYARGENGHRSTVVNTGRDLSARSGRRTRTSTTSRGCATA